MLAIAALAHAVPHSNVYNYHVRMFKNKYFLISKSNHCFISKVHNLICSLFVHTIINHSSVLSVLTFNKYFALLFIVMSLQDLLHAVNNGERLGDTIANDQNGIDLNRNVRNRDDNGNNVNNEPQVSHPRPSIVTLDTLSRKERKIMTKSKSITLPTLLRGNDLYFDTSIKLHRSIFSGQLIRLITPSTSSNKIPWYAQKNGQRGAGGQTNYDRLMFSGLSTRVLKKISQWTSCLS